MKTSAVFKNCPLSEQGQLINTHCLLPISMGQPFHEGDKLSAIIELINKRFKSCTVIICDSLYRHTLMIEPDIDQLKSFSKSIENGNLWLNRNKVILDQLSIPSKVTRWDYWVKNNKAQSKLEKSIVYLYKNNTNFHDYFDQSVNEFVARYSKKFSNQEKIDQKKAFQHSLNYLIEECAAIITIWNKEHYQSIIYPGKILKAITVTIQHLLAPHATYPIRWLQPIFKKISKKNITYYLDE